MLSIRSTADVTKVRRFSSVVVDHVESCHDKTRAVPHNSYITVKLDKRQTVLTSLSLQRSHLATSLFRPFLKFWMAKETVVVHYDAKVRSDKFSIIGLDQRIALDKFGIIDDRQTIQVREKISQRVQALTRITQLQTNLSRIISPHTKHGVEPMVENLFRTLLRHILNIDSALV